MLRASLRGLMRRKLRVLLAVIAVVLGVMFLSGAFVLSDTLNNRFRALFETVNENIAVQVALTEDAQQTRPTPLLSKADVDRIAAVDGVAAIDAEVVSQGVVPFDAQTGKAVTTQGAPQLGVGVAGDDPLGLVSIAEGRWPEKAGEVAVTRFTAGEANVGIGQQLKLFLPGAVNQARQFTVSGVAVYSGDRASLGGETLVMLWEQEAQQVFFGGVDQFSGVSLSADDGVDDTTLRDRVAAVTPAAFEAKTGEQVSDDSANAVSDQLGVLTTAIVVFALIALVVSAFLIFNTFNVVVAQRVRELALLRALGADWKQVTGSVLAEAVIVGLVGSTLGLAAGIGLGALGIWLIASGSPTGLPGSGVDVTALPVVLAYVVGVGVTVVAAFIPALKASTVAPLAAMRETARLDKPLRVRTIIGLVIMAVGAGLLALGLNGLGGATMLVVGLGVAVTFGGAIVLAPALARPIGGVVGRLLAWGTSGKLGYRNALRNPRRTAVTASALMIGVTLVSAVSVLASSFKDTFTDAIRSTVGAELVVMADVNQPPDGTTGFPTSAVEQVRKLPEVLSVASFHAAIDAKIDGVVATASALQVVALDNLDLSREMFSMETASGELRTLKDGEFVTDSNTAEARGWTLGDQIVVGLPGGDLPHRLVGVVESTPIWANNVILPMSATAKFAGPLAVQAYVDLRDGSDLTAAINAVNAIMADYPLVTVQEQSAMLKQFTDIIDTALNIVAGLLALAILIALLGIVNTLLLSIYERTREMGMLRAIGLGRGGLARMIAVESVVMAVFGCLLGVGLGVGLGAAVSAALVNQDWLTAVTVPWLSLVWFVVAAVGAGLVASLIPAIRAAWLNVLDAIAYE
ncbi:ABC transporter permease [Pilimelia columellifera]|uniref:ABC transporter permease n=1 Tax=Pilimelia columellifera subsp. columellifera TaxID=706583 RepID=A0ABP6AWF8_9ACTN